MNIMKRNVAVLIFNNVEVLDFCGPFEVFSVASNRGEDFNVFTVAEHDQPVLTIGGLSVNPSYTIHNSPKPNILLVPGGMGTRVEMYNEVLINWIHNISKESELVLSVCTGALMLAKANLLDGLTLTTHHMSFDLLRNVAPKSAEIVEGVRYVDNGRIILSAGISAGIDMSLYVVKKLLGAERAIATANRMEYEWNDDKYIL